MIEKFADDTKWVEKVMGRRTGSPSRQGLATCTDSQRCAR